MKQAKETDKKKQLLSVTALAKLLHAWQADSKEATSLATCQKLAQVPSLRGILEYLVLNTIVGDKAKEIRMNLRIHDPKTEAADEKVRAHIEKLQGRSNELTHLIDETKKAVERAVADAHQARCVADQSAVEKDIHQQRLHAANCQTLAFQALSSYTATQTEKLHSSVEALSLLKPSDAKGPDTTPADITNTLQKLRAILGEGEAKAPAQVASPQTAPHHHTTAPALNKLNTISCTEGHVVLSALRSTLNTSMHELVTMGCPEVEPTTGLDTMRVLATEGQASHIKLFLKEEGIKKRTAELRREAACTCKQILERLDHQSTLARQLTEVQARRKGAEVQKQVLDEQLRGMNVETRSIHKRLAASEKRTQLDALRAKRDSKLMLSNKLAEMTQMLDEVPAKPGMSPPRPPAHGIVSMSNASRQSMIELEEADREGRANRYQELLQGTSAKLLDGIAHISSLPDKEDDSPVNSVENSLLRLHRLLRERSALKEAEMMSAKRLQEVVLPTRDAITQEVTAGVKCWQDCVQGFSEVVRRIKEGKQMIEALDGDFTLLLDASRDLAEQPAAGIIHKI